MPVSIREMFLIVRARDEASNTLRRVGQNLSRMQTLADAQARQTALRSAISTNAAAQIATQSALVTKGEQFSAALREQSALESQARTIAESKNAIWQQGVRIEQEQIAAQEQLNALSARHASILGATGGVQTPLTRDVAAQMGVAAERAAVLQKQLDGVSIAYDNMAAQAETANSAVASQTAAVQTLKGEYAALQAQLASLIAEQQALADEQARVNAQVRAMKFDNFNRAAHAAGNLGRTMQYLGGIGVAALGFAAHAAASLNTQIGLAATQVANSVHGVAVQTGKDTNFILAQMQKFPAASSDMAKALYDIYSTLNVTAKQGRAVLQDVNKLAVAGQLSTQDAAQGLLSIMNNFKVGVGGIPAVLNRMAASVRFGRTTFAEFQTLLATAAPAARAAQQSFNELAGTIAFLSRSLGPSKAGIGFARLLEVLSGPQMTKGLKGFGVSLTDARGRILPLSQQIDILVKKFPYLTQGGQKAINFFKDIGGLQGTIQARRAFVTLVTNVQGYRNILAKTTQDNNEFKKSYTALAATAGVQWGVLLNTLKAVFIMLGAAVLPVFVKLVQPLKHLAQWFSTLDKGTQSLIGKWLAFAAIGAVLVGTLLSVGSALALIASGLAEGGIGAFFGGAIAAVPALVAIGAAVYVMYQNWDTVKGIVVQIAAIIQTLVGWINAIPAPIKTAVVYFIAIYSAVSLMSKALIALRGVAVFTAIAESAGVMAGAITAGTLSVDTLTASFAALDIAMGPVGWIALIATVGVLAVHFGVFGSSVNKTQQSVDELNKSLKQMGTAGQSLVTARSSMQQQNIAIQQTRNSLSKLHQGTLAYKSTEATLNSLQQQRIQTLHDLTKAQNELNAATRDSSGHLSDLTSQGAFNPTFALGLNAAQAAAKLADLQSKPGLSEGSAQTIAALTQQLDTFKNTRAVLSSAIDQYKTLIAEGISPTSASMKDLKKQIMEANRQLFNADPTSAMKNYVRMDAFVLKITKDLGRVPSQGLQNYLAALPKSIQAAEQEYSKLTGRVLSDRLAHVIFDNKKIGTALAAFFATTKDKLGSKLTIDMNKLINIGQGKDASNALNKWITNFIQKFHHLPSSKQIKIEIGVIDKATAQAKKIADKVAAQAQRVSHLQHLAFQTGHTAQGGDVSNALDAAQKKLDKLKGTNLKFKASMNWSPNDPWEPFAKGAKGAPKAIDGVSQTLVSKLSAAGTDAGTGFKQAFDAEAQKLAATGQLTIDVFKKSIGAHSPATKFMPVGRDAMQGVILGMINEAQGGKTKADIAAATKTISDAFMSKWQEIQSTMQSNFGDLFSGTNRQGVNNIQDKIDWGEKLNIKDLQKNLRTQNQSFSTFRKDLRRLTARGAPLGLIQQLEQMGPSANAELEALTHATKGQLKRYERLWNESQKNVGKATRHAFNVQRAQWTKHGRDMAIGILLGLKSGEPHLEAYFKHLAQIMIGSLQRHNKSHSPSKLYYDEGRNMMMGLQLGMNSVRLGMGTPSGRIHGLHPKGGDTFNINIDAKSDSSLDATAKRLAFRLKHR